MGILWYVPMPNLDMRRMEFVNTCSGSQMSFII